MGKKRSPHFYDDGRKTIRVRPGGKTSEEIVRDAREAERIAEEIRKQQEEDDRR